MAAPKDNKVEKLIQDVTNRYRVTAREARDIVTSVSSAAKAAATSGPTSSATKATVGNIGKQVKEVASAAKSGKVGTAPMLANTGAKSVIKDSTTTSQVRRETNPKMKNYGK